MDSDRIASSLRTIGLSEKESAVYLAVLMLGEASISDVGRKAHLKWTITYNLMKSMLMKGFLSAVRKGKRTQYAAVHPRRLLQLAKLHEHQIEEALPELIALHKGASSKPRLQLYEGIDGVRQAYRELFDTLGREEILWISDIDAVMTRFPHLLDEYLSTVQNRKRVRIRSLVARNEGGHTYKTRFSGMEDVRFIPPAFAWKGLEEAIAGRRVYQFVLGENLFVAILDEPTIAEARKAMFEFLWRSAK